MSDQKPSIGRIVHFHGERDNKPLAAIVTNVYDEEDGTVVDLFIIGQNGLGFRNKVPQGPDEGFWMWPPRI